MAWSRSGLLSLLLIPVVVAFSVQGALEVLHPFEEGPSAGHEHTVDGPTLGDIAQCGVGLAHSSHYCPHSNALARLDSPAAAFGFHVEGNRLLPEPVSQDVRPVPTVPGRGPPLHG